MDHVSYSTKQMEYHVHLTLIHLSSDHELVSYDFFLLFYMDLEW